MLIIAGIQMAMYWVHNFSSKIIDYLLVDAWDIENSRTLQSVLWFEFLERVSLNDSRRPASFDVVLQQSKRISALGQVIHANVIHNLVRLSKEYSYLYPADSLYDDLFKFLISQGADIECGH